MKTKVINKNMWKYVDWTLVVIIFILVGYSILSIVNATASPFTGDEKTFAEFFANLNLNSAMWQVIFFIVGHRPAVLGDGGAACGGYVSWQRTERDDGLVYDRKPWIPAGRSL